MRNPKVSQRCLEAVKSTTEYGIWCTKFEMVDVAAAPSPAPLRSLALSDLFKLDNIIGDIHKSLPKGAHDICLTPTVFRSRCIAR